MSEDWEGLVQTSEAGDLFDDKRLTDRARGGDGQRSAA